MALYHMFYMITIQMFVSFPDYIMQWFPTFSAR